jgi:hypothetical protein
MADDKSNSPLGRLPRLTDPQRYRGLYIIDFGDGVSVGYLPAEVTTLVASGQFPQMRVYRIHRAMPDGTLDLVSVPMHQFREPRNETMLFLRQYEAEARIDFETLKNYAPGKFPCPARLQLAELPQDDYPFTTVLTYPAEYTDAVSQWLLDINYDGGDTVEFGPNKMTSFHQTPPEILEEATLEPTAEQVARPLKELLATRQYAIQR